MEVKIEGTIQTTGGASAGDVILAIQQMCFEKGWAAFIVPK